MSVKIVFFDGIHSRNTDQIINRMDKLVQDYEDKNIAGFSIIIAYSDKDVEYINSWKYDYKDDVALQSGRTPRKVRNLRNSTHPYALPAESIVENFKESIDEINEHSELKFLPLDYELFLTKETRLAIPSNEQSLISFYNPKIYQVARN